MLLPLGHAATFIPFPVDSTPIEAHWNSNTNFGTYHIDMQGSMGQSLGLLLEPSMTSRLEPRWYHQGKSFQCTEWSCFPCMSKYRRWCRGGSSYLHTERRCGDLKYLFKVHCEASAKQSVSTEGVAVRIIILASPFV